MNLKKVTSFKYFDLILACISAAIVFVLLFIQFGFAHCGISSPYEYDGDDVTQWYLIVKSIGENGWFWTTDRVGAPYSLEVFDFSGFFLMNFDFLISKILILIIKDLITTMNVQLLLTCSLCSFTAYLTFREIKIRRVLSVFGSVLYGTTPFIIYCGLFHFSLTVAYFVPFSILLCYWCNEYRNDFLKFDKGFFKNKRNILAIVFAVLICNSGWGYYAIFTCFFLCISALIELIDSKKFSRILPEIKLVIFHGLMFVISLLPVLVYQHKNGNNLSIALRSPAEGEIYGLKIAQFFIPTNNTHHIKFLEDLVATYNNNMPLVNENRASYLGLVGIVGFIISLYFVIRTNSKSSDKYSNIFSKMILGAILFATVGGFSGLLSVYFHFIRAYNRISIFIVFLCITVLLISFDRIIDTNKTKKYIPVIIFLFLFICVLEQIPDRSRNIDKINHNYEVYVSDRDFVKAIEAQLNTGDMVYQLPYHKFPEGGVVNQMTDYNLFVGYIHSENLKWSYGGIKGRDSDIWNEYVASLSTEDMINTICANGFRGIYIDSKAYTDSEIFRLTRSIERITGLTAMNSANGNLIFYNLYPYIDSNPEILEMNQLDVNDIKYPDVSFNQELMCTLDNTDALEYIVSGMSFPEENFTWVTSDEIHIMFHMPEDKEEATLVINVDNTFNGVQRYRVYVNDERIISSEINGGGEIDFTFNNDDDTYNDIVIEFPDSVSPQDLNISNDARDLSVAISSVEFR